MHLRTEVNRISKLLAVLPLGLILFAGCGGGAGGSAVEHEMRAAIQSQIEAHDKLAAIYEDCRTDAEFNERAQEIQQQLAAAEKRADELDEAIPDEEKSRIKEDKLLNELHGAKMKRAEARYDFRVRKTSR